MRFLNFRSFFFSRLNMDILYPSLAQTIIQSSFLLQSSHCALLHRLQHHNQIHSIQDNRCVCVRVCLLCLSLNYYHKHIIFCVKIVCRRHSKICWNILSSTALTLHRSIVQFQLYRLFIFIACCYWHLCFCCYHCVALFLPFSVCVCVCVPLFICNFFPCTHANSSYSHDCR